VMTDEVINPVVPSLGHTIIKCVHSLTALSKSVNEKMTVLTELYMEMRTVCSVWQSVLLELTFALVISV
jgi:hypothetical protein